MLHGSSFGDAVRKARDAAFKADSGASNTWAAYQCYGDPAFQLTRGARAAPPLMRPVSADELVRRLEDISVGAGDSGRDDHATMLNQVVELENTAPAAWRRQARVLGALGDSYRNLSSDVEAIRCYREAIETGDPAMCIGVVEQLANLEQSLAVELREKPDTKVTGLDPPPTEAALRTSAKERLDTLDAVGRSAVRHALRGGWHKREAALLSQEGDRANRTTALTDSAKEYVAAWRLDQKPYGCLNALQLATLGGDLPPDVRTELVAWVRDEVTAPRSADFWDRVAAADRQLTLALIDNHLASEADDIAEAYLQVFEDRSRPSERDSVASHLKHLGSLATGETKEHLDDLHDRLSEWKPCS